MRPSNLQEKVIAIGSASFGKKPHFFAYEFLKQKRLLALQKAIQEHNMHDIKKLVHDDPCIVNYQLMVSKRFPVLMAIQYKNEEALNFLLKKGPNLLLVSEQGETVLTALPQVENKRLRNKLLKNYHFQLNHALSIGEKPFSR